MNADHTCTVSRSSSKISTQNVISRKSLLFSKPVGVCWDIRCKRESLITKARPLTGTRQRFTPEAAEEVLFIGRLADLGGEAAGASPVMEQRR